MLIPRLNKHTALHTALPGIEALIMLILLSAKLITFSRYIQLGSFAIPISLASVTLMLAVGTILFFLRRRVPVVFIAVLYTIIGIVLLVDSVYFSYVGRLPSVSAIQMAGQLTAVTATISALITPMHLMFIIDLPLWLVYAVTLRPILRRNVESGDKTPNSAKRVMLTSSLLTGALFLSITGSCLFTDMEPEYLTNEIMTYHMTDVYNVLLDNTSSGIMVDAMGYIGDDTESDLNGVAAGRNVITLQIEAMQNFIIGFEYNGVEITPNLNALLNIDTLYFDSYYYQVGGGNTSDVEFITNNSLFSPESVAAYIKYGAQTQLGGLPVILKANDYTGAYAFHGYEGSFWNRKTAYSYAGFDKFYAQEDLENDEIIGLGISDSSVFSQAVDILTTYEEPFYAMIVTLSSHHPYSLPAEYCEIELDSEHVDTLFGDYLNAMHYVDATIGEFLDELREAGLYDNSIISIYGDHVALPSYDERTDEIMSEYLGREYYEGDMFNVPLIIHIPGLGDSETVSTVCGHIDFLPTLLGLLGIKNDISVMFGHNILTTESGVVYEQMHAARGSFISEDYVYLYPSNGITANAVLYDRHTGERITDYDKATVYNLSRMAITQINACMNLLDNNRLLLCQ